MHKLDINIFLWLDRVFIHHPANKKYHFSFNIQAIKCLTLHATAPVNQGLTNKFAYDLKVCIIVSIPSDIVLGELDIHPEGLHRFVTGFKQLNA